MGRVEVASWHTRLEEGFRTEGGPGRAKLRLDARWRFWRAELAGLGRRKGEK